MVNSIMRAIPLLLSLTLDPYAVVRPDGDSSHSRCVRKTDFVRFVHCREAAARVPID